MTGFKGLFECNKKVRKNSAFDIFVKGILNFIHIFLVYSYIPINGRYLNNFKNIEGYLIKKPIVIQKKKKANNITLDLDCEATGVLAFALRKTNMGHPKEPDLIPQSHGTIIHMIIVISLLLGCII